jgi:acyl-CoA synthetase (NDP forming)
LGLHHLPALQEDFVDRVWKLSKKYKKSVVACDVGETEMALYIRSRFDRLGIPSYFSPEDAARGMAALVKYGQYLKKCEQFEQYVELFMKRKRI